MINRFSAALIVMSLLQGCASSRINDSIESRVSRLINETTRSPLDQEKALIDLEKLGQQAVPYIVGHLNDVRPLARPEMSLVNKTSASFEGVRRYSPYTVHDALTVVLNQITEKSFGFVYNGATPEDREKNRQRWVEWCKSAYPDEVEGCIGVLQAQGHHRCRDI